MDKKSKLVLWIKQVPPPPPHTRVTSAHGLVYQNPHGLRVFAEISDHGISVGANWDGGEERIVGKTNPRTARDPMTITISDFQEMHTPAAFEVCVTKKMRSGRFVIGADEDNNWFFCVIPQLPDD